MITLFKKKTTHGGSVPTDTRLLVAKRISRTLFRMHLSATFALFTAISICLVSVFSTLYFLNKHSVDHVLKIRGVLQATEQPIPISHNTGGIIRDVFVSEGEVVSEGQILMSLDTRDLKADHTEAKRVVASLMLQSLCLKAERSSQIDIHVPEALILAIGRLNQLEKLHRSMRNCRNELRKIALLHLQENDEIINLQEKIHLLGRLSHAGQSLQGRLHQLNNETQEYQLQDAINLQHLVKTLKYFIKLSDARKQLKHLRVNHENRRITQLQTLDNRIDHIIDLLSRAEGQLSQLESLKENRYIYASSRGRVQHLRIKKGGVHIAAKALLLEIEPLTTDFEVVASINIADFPYIQKGQAVEVHLSTGVPNAIPVPATIINIINTTRNTRTLRIAISREDLKRRNVSIDEIWENGLGQQSEALIEVKTETALKTIGRILGLQV